MVLLAGLALEAAPAHAMDDPSRVEWNRRVEPFRIVGQVYFVGAAGVSAFLVKTTKGAIVIDGGFAETAPLIAANLAQLGVAITDVRLLLSSHAHFDHAGGLAELKRRSHARLVASRADAPDLESGRSVDFGDEPDVPFPRVHVDRRVSDGERIVLGDVTLTAHVTAGHTRGCTTWTMRTRDGERDLDVVFHCSTSVPGYRLLGNSKYPTIVEDYRRSFAVLAKLPCDVLLAPHPFFFDLDGKRARLVAGAATNPFIDRDELRRFVAESTAAFEAELAKQRGKQP